MSLPSILFVLLSGVGVIEDIRRQDDALYCQKVRTRAWADAAPLMFPELVSQMFRFPAGTLDPQLIGGLGSYQLRVGLAYSITDLVRGARTLNMAAADCALQSTKSETEDVLASAADIGKLAALTRQAAYFEGQRAEWKRIESIARDRLKARGITYLDFAELRKRVTSIERKSAQVRGELGRVEALRLPPRPSLGTLTEVVKAYEERSAVFERRSDEARFAQAWQVRLTGGFVPLQLNDAGRVFGNQIDWYGLIEFRFRFGGVAGDAGYLNARAAEVRTARYELPERVARLQRQLASALRQARDELATVEEQLRTAHEARSVLEQSDADNAVQAIALLRLDAMLFEADRIYLRSLIDELSATTGEQS